VKYTVSVDGSVFTVQITGAEVLVDGRATQARLRTVTGTPLRQLVLPERTDTFAMVRKGNTWSLLQGGEIWEAEVIDERTRQLREMTGQSGERTGEQVVRAPMPGLVLRVEVEVGMEVLDGTGLVVLEAMKMENELSSPVAGRVKEIHVTPGEAVDKGAPLVVVGP